jgi:hypothetical protein
MHIALSFLLISKEQLWFDVGQAPIPSIDEPFYRQPLSMALSLCLHLVCAHIIGFKFKFNHCIANNIADVLYRLITFTISNDLLVWLNRVLRESHLIQALVLFL